MPAPPDTLNLARSHLAAGRYAQAEEACRTVLGDNEAHPPALHLLGLIRGQTGRLEEGAALLERAVQLAPESVAARNDLGAMLIALGRPLPAEEHLRAAVALNPSGAEGQVNLANAVHAQGRLEAAEALYRTALLHDPRHVRGLMSLGNLLCQMRRSAEAIGFLTTTVELAPGSAAAHQFLGNALRDVGRSDDAMASYRRAIIIEPALGDANESLGILLKDQARFEEAITCFRASGKPYARALALECELGLGRTADFFRWLEAHAAGEATNLHSASLSAYAAQQLARADPHPFCPEPLTRVRVIDRYTTAADAQFLRDLIREAGQLEAVWEPRGVTTKQGFQTGGNLFDHGLAALNRLQEELVVELQRYRVALDSGHPSTRLTLATRWPRKMRLQGWYVRLLTGGHQHFHNHPFGWMSGCLYLQMPTQATAGEGAIEFGLESGHFPRLSDRPPPTLLHQPVPGQLALFPSSLFHRTMPFRSDEERLCIAFDLLPA